jgi:S1-C subfamily serine protease
MKTSMLLLLTALAAANVHAEDKAPPEDLEKRLEAARERLEEAAREVAELSTELGAPLIDRFMAFDAGQRRAIIGVQLDPDSAKEGARIREVSPGGPAAEAGLRRGDVIVAVNGKELKGSDSAVRELTRRLRETEPDTKVKLRYLRDGKTQDVDVVAQSAWGARLAMRGMPLTLPEIAIAPEIAFEAGEHLDLMHGMRGALAGMELASLTPELGRYFGTEKGVLVVRAPQTDTFRLEDGDVIVSVDGREPRNGSHATRILRSYQPGEKVKLRVMRQKKPLDLEVVLPERAPRHRAAREERA